MISNVPSPIAVTGFFKQGWERIKNAYLQKVNGVKEVAAPDFDSAYAKAESCGMKKFFWQGKCYNTAYDGSLPEERKAYNPCNGSKIAGKRIPQGENRLEFISTPLQEKDNMKRQQSEERQQRLQNTMQKAHERLQEVRKKIQMRQQEREAAANGQGAENMALFSQRLQQQNAMLRLQLQEKLQKLGR